MHHAQGRVEVAVADTADSGILLATLRFPQVSDAIKSAFTVFVSARGPYVRCSHSDLTFKAYNDDQTAC
jgi:hypothetical protein